MFNFDFHNLLNYIEFEALCSHILEIRDAPLKFTTYGIGKDGGIDFKCTKNSPLKIIGQAKLYNPKNEKNLLSILKEEVTKCKRKKPDRYILCISLELTPNLAEKILTLFEGYIKDEEDIIDRIKLNKYFNDKDNRYNHLLKSYSKLLVPNFQVVENMLNDVVNRKYINASRRFISQIKDKHRLYCNDILRNCLDVLEQNRVIILTGNPGVGKTTTAQMLVQYFLSVESDKKYEFYSFRNPSFLNEVEHLFEIDKQQIFVFDDFWGSQFNENTPNEAKNRDYQKTFVEILNEFKKSKNHYLILTSRNYIIRDALAKAEQDFKDIVEINNFTVDLNNFSNEVKAKIFLNHLVFYGKDISYFKGLKYEDRLERIIKHPNYTPRHIEHFFTRVHRDSLQNGFGFEKDFLSYLEKPQDFWNNLFDSQNDNSRLILILLFISSDPIEIQDLKKSYLKIQKSTREELNLNLQPLEFEKDLYLLEDIFISSEKWEYIDQVLLSFQSPGIKDFLLEYLRQNIDFFGKILIKGAIFFNQLYYT